MRNYIICPKCGSIYREMFTKERREKGHCVYCGFPMKDQIDTGVDGSGSMSNKQYRKLVQELLDKYYFCDENTHFDREAYDKRMKEDEEMMAESAAYIKQREQAERRLVCPCCGSQSFTPLRRKWSLFSGFMTNKVDMVCNGCGYVKKS